MIKTIKYLRFSNFKLELQQKHPKQISRTFIFLTDQQGKVYKNTHYGQVTTQMIIWDDIIEILYTNQLMFKLDTVCEYEYGYQRQQLQSMYNGQIYIKTENFYRPLFIHIYDTNGRKCGIMRYITKVIEKQEVQKQAPQAVIEKIVEQEPVKVDLIGKIRLFNAQIIVTHPALLKQQYKKDLKLDIQICNQSINANCNKNLQSNFLGAKIQHMQNSPSQIFFVLKHKNDPIMAGQTSIKNIIENKRFSTHQVTMYNLNGNKIGILKLDLRYLTKLEILDLMYSPTKLSKNKESITQQQKSQQNSGDFSIFNKHSGRTPSKPSKSRSNSSMMELKHQSQGLKRQSKSYDEIQPQIFDKSKSISLKRKKQINPTGSYNELSFHKPKRFSQYKDKSGSFSFNDVDTIKFQNIKPAKNRYLQRKPAKAYRRRFGQDKNQYKLPSIWQKY